MLNLIRLQNKYKLNKIHSANIQAEFYSRCKENNIICYLEFKDKNSRFDALVFNDDLQKKAIIEFKSYKDKNKKTNLFTKQILKYTTYNLNIYVITRFEQIDEVISKLKILLTK